MTFEGIVAVVGATGQQGGAAAWSLLKAGAQVRALVRDPGKPSAQALASAGAQLAIADLEDPDTIRTAFEGVSRVFLMTTMGSGRGTVGETADGIAVADAAEAASVEHLVYSSVGGAERHTGIPHFESKRRVEEHIETLDLEATFVRPTFFYENLLRQPSTREDGAIVVRLPLADDIPLQMVAVKDIGAVAAAVLLDPSRVPGGSVEIAGDDDLQAMFSWFAQPPSYQADRVLTAELDPQVENLEQWLARQWKP